MSDGEVSVRSQGRAYITTQLQGLKGRKEQSISGFIRASILALLILMQFAIIIAVSILLRQFSVAFYTIMEFGAIIAILMLTNDNRSMAYKFGWLCIIAVLPVAGIIMFFMWGRVGKNNKLNKSIIDHIKEVDSHIVRDDEVSKVFRRKHPVSSRISRYMESQGQPLYRGGEVEYFEMGDYVLADIVEKLESAKSFIFMEFFIIAEGAIWDRVHRILKQKVSEGVEVKLIYDDFGGLMRTPTTFASELRAEGIEVGVFNPIGRYLSKLYMNFRTHRKIVIIDGKYAYTGGFNLADEYANLVERFGIWKDCGIRVTGDAVWGMTIVFFELWSVCAITDGTDFDKYHIASPVRSDGDGSVMPDTTKGADSKGEESSDSLYCHVLRDGPALGPRSFLESTYRQMVQYAGRTLYIMTPYLMPEDIMRDALIEAAARHVDVRIITPHVPDKKRIKWMTEYNYGPLLKAGVRIYEYLPGFIHSKVIMNEHSAIVGTINMDYRSFYLHYENGIWVYDEKFRKKVNDDFKKTFAESKEITYKQWKDRPFKLKIVQAFLHVFDTLV